MEQDLTDTEKLIVATVIINKQTANPMTLDRRAELIKEYSKSLQVFDKGDLYYNMKRELDQLRLFLKSAETGEVVNYYGNYSGLTKREKYIYYNTELMFVEDLPFIVLATVKSSIMIMLDIKEDKDLLELVETHINQVLDYLQFADSKI